MSRPAIHLALLVALLGIVGIVETDALIPGVQGAGAEQQTAKPAPPASPPPVSTAPVASAVRPQQGQLKNGLQLLVIEDHRLPEFVLQLHMQGAGSYFDPPDKNGLAAATASVAYRATPTKSFDDLVDLWKEWDADLAMVSRGGSTVTVLVGKAPSRSLRPYFDVVAEMVTTPQFADEDVKAVQGRARSLAEGWKANPRFRLDEAFLRALNGSHPAGVYEPLASPALGGFTAQQLAAFAKEHYAPDHAVLAIAGDVSFADAKKLAEDTFKGWQSSGRAMGDLRKPSEPGAKLHLVDMQTPRARLALGTLVASRSEPDFDTLDVLANVLGSGPTSRLGAALAPATPSDAGPADRPEAVLTSQKLWGTWRINATAKPEAVGLALQTLEQQIARLRSELVAAEELDAAKKVILQKMLGDQESSQSRLSNALAVHMLSLPADYWEKRPEKLAAVTAEQVRAAARKYLDPKRLVIAIVGPRATIEPQLKGLSVPVTFVGPDGATIARR